VLSRDRKNNSDAVFFGGGGYGTVAGLVRLIVLQLASHGLAAPPPTATDYSLSFTDRDKQNTKYALKCSRKHDNHSVGRERERGAALNNFSRH